MGNKIFNDIVQFTMKTHEILKPLFCFTEKDKLIKLVGFKIRLFILKRVTLSVDLFLFSQQPLLPQPFPPNVAKSPTEIVYGECPISGAKSLATSGKACHSNNLN